jgi:voltage-gated potassium channel
VASFSNSGTRIIVGLSFLLLTCVTGVTGYLVAGWRLLDALYMVVITIFGVGYGEVRALESDSLRVFTMCLIIIGCSSLVYIMSGVFQLITEGELNRALGRRRMNKDIEKLSGHVIVCGFGRIGRVLAKALSGASMPFVIVDREAARVEDAAGEHLLVLEGDATQEETLERAGIRRAKVLATVLPNDALNVFITLTARTLNDSLLIVARGEDQRTESKLLQAGADRVVMPAAIGGDIIAQLIVHPIAFDLFHEGAAMSSLTETCAALGANFKSLRIGAESRGVGRQVAELEAAGHGGYLVIAIRRADGRNVQAPRAEERFEANDEVLLLGRSSCMSEVAATFGTKLLPSDGYMRGLRVR